MKMMEGLATSSTAMVRRLRCSTLSPLRPGLPTMLFARPSSSTSSITCKQQADSHSCERDASQLSQRFPGGSMCFYILAEMEQESLVMSYMSPALNL